MILSKINCLISSLIQALCPAACQATYKPLRSTFAAFFMLSALPNSLQAGNLFITYGHTGGTGQINTAATNLTPENILSSYTLVDLVASHDGHYLYATLGDATLLIYDTVMQTTVLLDSTTLQIPLTAQLNSLLLSPDGTTLYAADEYSGNLISIGVSNWQMINNLSLDYSSTPFQGINLQAITPDGSLIYFTAGNGSYTLYSHETATSDLSTIVFDFTAGTFGFTVPRLLKLIPDGSAAYVLCNNANGGNDFFYVTDLATTPTLYAGIYFFETDSSLGDITDFCLSPEGSRAYVVGTSGIFTEVTGASSGTFAIGTPISTVGSGQLSKIVSSPSGDYFYALDNGANLVHKIDINSNSDIAQISIGSDPIVMVVARATPTVTFTVSDDESETVPIIINLLPNVAPQTVTNFLALAAGNYYDGSQLLYKGQDRIEIPHAIDQSIRDGSRSYFSAWKVGFAHENLSRTPPLYSVAMVSYADDLSGSGFFITTTTDALTASHNVFGIVTDPQSQTFLSKITTGTQTGVTIAYTSVQL